MNAGVSPKQVVEVTWQNVRVYDHGCHLLRSTPMGTFIGDAGLSRFPRNPENRPGHR